MAWASGREMLRSFVLSGGHEGWISKAVSRTQSLAVGSGAASGLAYYLWKKGWFGEKGVVQTNSDDMELKSVQVIFRHGARTPIHPWKVYGERQEGTITWSNFVPEKEDTRNRIPVTLLRTSGEKIGPMRWGKDTWNFSRMDPKHPSGELTELGYSQAVELGRRLRERYMTKLSFLPEVYSPKLVYCRSTGFNRTKQTAQGVLTGLFSGEKQPEEVVVYTRPWSEECIVANTRICPLYRQLYNHADVSRKGESTAQARRLVMEKLKIPEKMVNFVFLRDVLIARKVHGLPFPDGISQELWDAIDIAAPKTFTEPFRHEDRVPALKVGCGVMVHTLLENFQSVDKPDVPKLYLYSAHDSLVCPVLEALGAYDDVWPPFASNITFELLENKKKEKFVKVSYNDKEIAVAGCDGEACPLDKFTASLKKFALDKSEYQAVCNDKHYLNSLTTESQKPMSYL